MKRVAHATGLAVLWVAVVAATPLPLAPPPPTLTHLVPFVWAPLDKPPIQMPPLVLPPAPLEMPPIPPATVVIPDGEKPAAPVPAARTLPCVGAWTGVASEALECGRARFQRGDLEDAAKALDQAARSGGDRDLVMEARYWLGETFYRLGRIDQADAYFRQIGQERLPTFAQFGRHSSGWTALILGNPARARDAFAQILGVSHPVVIDAWARHGLGLSYYALGRFADAERTFADLLARRPPPVLERDALFWHGDCLGRIGEPEKAVAELSRFIQGRAHTQGRPHTLLAPAYARLAWWSHVAKRAPESLAAARAYASARTPEPRPEGARPLVARSAAGQDAVDRDWIDAVLALGLLASDDVSGAKAAAQPLIARRSPVSVPLQLRLARVALERRALPSVDAAIAETMRGTLTPPVRAWLLIVKGDAARMESKLDDARTQFDLARGTEEGSATGRYATFRLAQTNLEMREATQALVDLGPLLNARLDPSMQTAVLLLQGEAAYRAGNYKTATAAFGRVLTETPDHPGARDVRLGLAWTALREGRVDDAGQRFAEYVELQPDDEQTPNALVLASEMALQSGNLAKAREMLDRVVARYPQAPRTDFARLNRAILMLRSGDAASAVPLLRDWITRAPFAPFIGRAQVALAVALLASGQPDEAKREFAAARREGEGALVSLGLATAALAEDRPAEATRDFQDARSDGTRAVAIAAEYGLLVAAFQRGDIASFRTGAQAVLAAEPRGPAAPRLLYALTGTAADAREWRQALATARKLVTEFPDDERADDALERVGAAAARERVWPVASEAWTLLRDKYPGSPFIADSALLFGEAQFEVGRLADARKTLEQALGSAPPSPTTGRAWFILARARETAGDRGGAADAYTKAAEVTPALEWDKDTFFRYVGLLTQERRYAQARNLLEPYIRTAPTVVAVDAAVALAETLQAQGDRAGAVEYFMTAAYIAPETTVGRRALLAAGRAFAAQRQNDAASIVYRKLLSQSDVPPDLAGAARQGLAELGR